MLEIGERLKERDDHKIKESKKNTLQIRKQNILIMYNN